MVFGPLLHLSHPLDYLEVCDVGKNRGAEIKLGGSWEPTEHHSSSVFLWESNWSSTHSDCVDQDDLKFSEIPCLFLLATEIKGVYH